MQKILLVEDEKDVAAAIITLLQSVGYKQVTPVYTGKEAIETLQKERFDLAIIDLILPDMNGNQLCAMIRHHNKFSKLPIIVSTAIGDDSTQRMAADLGINEFLSKPYAPEDLLAAVKRCLK